MSDNLIIFDDVSDKNSNLSQEVRDIFYNERHFSITPIIIKPKPYVPSIDLWRNLTHGQKEILNNSYLSSVSLYNSICEYGEDLMRTEDLYTYFQKLYREDAKELYVMVRKDDKEE